MAQTTAGTVSTTKAATVDAINVDVLFTLTMNTGVEPTDETTGFVYVIQNGVVKKAASQTSLSRWGTNGALEFTKVVYRGGDTKITAEDATWLNGKKYAIYVKSDGADGHVRIAASTTGTGEAERVVNDDESNGGNGVLLGYVSFTADGEHDPQVTYKNASDAGSALTPYYYAYNPVTHGAAGSSEDADEYVATPALAGITITLTLQ